MWGVHIEVIMSDQVGFLMKKAKDDSPVLKENLRKLLSEMGIDECEHSPIRAFNASFANAINFPDLGIYDSSFDQLIENFSFSPTSSGGFKSTLEQVASIYLKIYPARMSSLFHKEHIERMKRLAKYANLLKSEINKVDQNFLEFLDLANHFEEKEEGEPTVYEFLNSTRDSLVVLENLETGVKNSNFGKMLGMGKPSKKQNIALKTWVHFHYEIWINGFGRTMERDKTGIGGRKRFLEYLDQLMAPLHPEMCSHNIDLSEVRENPITNDAMDSVLKVIQKEIKLRGKNNS